MTPMKMIGVTTMPLSPLSALRKTQMIQTGRMISRLFLRAMISTMMTKIRSGLTITQMTVILTMTVNMKTIKKIERFFNQAPVFKMPLRNLYPSGK